MGHFYTTVRGRGLNRQEAESNAIDEFLHEEGHRHSVRDVSKAKFLRKVPPLGVTRVERGREVHDYTAPNTEAPQDQWLEEWSFELHTHA